MALNSNRILSLVAVVALCLLAPIVLLSQQPSNLTLEMLFHPDQKVDFDGDPPQIEGWLNDGRYYVERTRGESGSRLVKVDALSGASETLLQRDQLKNAFVAAGLSREDAAAVSEAEFTFSSDEGAVLLEHDDDLFYFDFASEQAGRLTNGSEPEIEATFSPDGAQVAFLRSHDLYVIDLPTGQERRLTQGGNPQLLNGELDWVYQEEIYGRGDFKGFWWAPGSDQIVYLQLDETPVPDFTVVDHRPQHLKTEVTRYPKAGDGNPLARLGVVGARGGPVRWLDTSGYTPEDLLIVRVGWTPDERVVFQAQNKEQTWLDLNVANPLTGEVKRLFREETKAWVNVLDEPHWLGDGSFLWESERNGWRHLYHYSADGHLKGAVTTGDWEVRDFHGYDADSGWLYFSGTERGPLGADVYRIRLDGSGLTRLTERKGTHRATFNAQLTQFVDVWSDLETPPQTRLHDNNGRELRLIDGNQVSELAALQLGRTEFLQVETRDGFWMEALLIRPPDFDASKKYPVLVYTYGGPHAQSVVNRWRGTRHLWHQMLAQKGFVVWICDNRSASGKGAQSSWPIHRNLGELELRDIEDGLQWLRSKPWIDAERIGIWGWSYGGYMTSYALTHSRSFKLGIAGAPVTDWSLYDTVYTERYMGTPQNNPEGYQKSSVLAAADQLHGKLLLIHGTIDDNVHMQNTIRLIDQLQKAGKHFELMLYPGSRHGVRNPQQVYHLQSLMTRFLEDNL